MLEKINFVAEYAEFLTVLFDGSSALGSDVVLGLMLASLREGLAPIVRCIGSIEVRAGHRSDDISGVIREIARERIADLTRHYFVSDSATTKKATAQKFIQSDEGEGN